MTPDAELLRAYAKDRSEPAFAELVRRHLNLVYSVALRSVAGDTYLAEDVTQQVFADLAAKAGPVSRHPVLGGWLVDHDMPRLIFYGSACFMVATILIAVAVERGAKR